jgi:drug/metabolite transporter (DMT)-like permease
MLNERFGWRDAAGVILAALGAVTVVLSAKQQDREVRPFEIEQMINASKLILTRMQFDPDALMIALKQPTFVGYSITVVILTHTPRYRDRFVVIDVLM